MGDQLDDKLKQCVKEVFDNFEDTSADAGWLLLRERYPEKKRRGVLWIWSAAAVLLLFIGFAIGVYVNDRQHDQHRLSDHVKVIRPEKPVIQQQKTSIVYQPDTVGQNKRIAEAAPKAGASYSSVGRQTITSSSLSSQASKPANSSKQYVVVTQQPVQVNSVVVDQPVATVTHPKDQANTMSADTSKGSSALNNYSLVTKVPQKARVTDTAAATAFPVAKPKSIDDMFAADKGKTDQQKISTDKRVLFGVFASTYFNYAKGSSNQVNVGAGFTADIPLAENLKLVTGLSVNQNTFDYANSVAVPSAPIFGSGGSNGSSTPTYSQNASLLALDVPLDLKYVVSNRKNQVYFLAGVGSGTFINESYAYLNSDGSTAASAQSAKGLNDFYFARTLNMALGLGYPLGKSQIVIEPFIKYPLQGLGAEQLRFGASGINLKFNFSIKK